MGLLIPNDQTPLGAPYERWPYLTNIAAAGTVPGIGNDGALVADAKFDNNGFNADGTGDYVNIGGAGVAAGQTALTLMGWIYLNSLAATNRIYYESINGGANLRLGVEVTTNGDMNMNGRNSDGDGIGSFARTATSAISAGAWRHFAAVFSAPSSHKIYLDGADATSSSGSGHSAFSSGTPLYVRLCWSTETLYNGLLADLRGYRRAFSQNEVQHHYNRTRR